MKFSPSVGTFYPDHIAYPEGAIPLDVIEVSDDQFIAALNRGPSETIAVVKGNVVVLTADGTASGSA